MRESLLLSVFLIVSVLFITGCSVTSQADAAGKDLETQPIQTTAEQTTKQIIQNNTTTSTQNTTAPNTTASIKPVTNIKPAVFSVSDMTIKPRDPAPGLTFTISVTVTNTGGSQGSYDVILYIHEMDMENIDNPTIMATMTFIESVIIAADESIIVTFEPFISDDGVYIATIDDLVDYLEVGQCTY